MNKSTPLPETIEPERFLTAYVSQDGKIVGIEHETVADWSEVREAHVALRDRLNERLAEEDKCPFKPVEAQDGEGLAGVRTVAEAIWRAQWAPGYEPSVTFDVEDAEDPDFAEPYLAMARAAIAALRRPVRDSECAQPSPKGSQEGLAETLREALPYVRRNPPRESWFRFSEEWKAATQDHITLLTKIDAALASHTRETNND